MRKIPFWLSCLSLLSISIFIFSCQKNADPTLPPGSEISSDNPAQLSAAIRVWHGKRTTGSPPPSTGFTPALDPNVNPVIRAFAGRYAIIKPEVLSAGEIAGYYVSIPFSGQYFKVDFTNPRNVAGRPTIPPIRRRNLFSRPQDGNADSSIVIVLPTNIQVPDTFCVTYCAYDQQGNIGQPITTCIIVSSLGGDASSAWLQNDWRLTSSWEVVNGQREYIDTLIYNKWLADGGYDCYTDSVTGTSTLYYIGWDPNPIVNDSLYYRKANLRFATNGAMDYEDDLDIKFLDDNGSTCTQFIFHPVMNYKDSIMGAWSFNSTTNKMILIFEFDSSGYPDPDIWEYDVIKVSNTQWILKDPWDDYYYRWER